ncbi:hypothetical protein JHK84_028175 [Glycine max]|uniref:Uncharacterized protein n=1 Tax=Glycine max TaxID=3847 RepID=K7LJ07_SOYBN|nr:hypothetical protein JHK85_028589 [Glycine max]KAG5003914.1 hypothetical protein JHK86_028053 [Glycine max]KAG5151703.1 hypothetical protein JHK84_028175 [Glycine max]KAH1137935.1 hypothetical protein GYH30_027784 [Glycine max]
MDIHDDRSGEDNEVARGIEDASHLDGAFEEKVSEKIVINILLDIVNINLTNIDSNDVKRFDFVDLSVAYLFYYWYGRANGFVCKSKVLRNCKGETTQQNFLCYREGVKDYRDITIEMQKHEEKMIQDVIVDMTKFDIEFKTQV